MTEFNAIQFQENLLKWFRANQRTLPWRTLGVRDPYSVLVSEIMLQQTQVATVLRYYERWMSVFPDFATLAAAPIEQVLKAWEGLGYYSRARNLQRIAQTVMTQYGGELPQEPMELEKLPGIGKYSARSIASLAFNAPVACVDGNIVRVLARLKGIDKPYNSGSAAQHDLCVTAQDIIAEREKKFNFGEYNEALMELGALICKKANPQCESCPMQHFCWAHANNRAADLPRFTPKKTLARFVKRVWIFHEGKLLLSKDQAEHGHLEGLWELPTPDALGIKRLPDKELLRRVRNITKYKITEVIYKITSLEKLLPRLKKIPHLKWAAKEDLEKLPLSGPHGQWIAEIMGRKNANPV